MRCEETSRYLSPYLDSELDPKTNFEISAHFDQCQTCRDRFEAERRIDHAMSTELKKTGPRDEESWNRAHSRVIRPSRRTWPWAVSLLAIVATATVFVAIHPREPVGLAVELRAAFITFEAGRSKLDVVGSDPKAVEVFCRDHLGLSFQVPQRVGAFELEGARKCSLRGATAAFLTYRSQDRRAGVFIFSVDHLDRFPAGDRVREPSIDETKDLRVALLRSGWKVIGVVGLLSPDELLATGRSFQD